MDKGHFAWIQIVICRSVGRHHCLVFRLEYRIMCVCASVPVCDAWHCHRNGFSSKRMLSHPLSWMCPEHDSTLTSQQCESLWGFSSNFSIIRTIQFVFVCLVPFRLTLILVSSLWIFRLESRQVAFRSQLNFVHRKLLKCIWKADEVENSTHEVCLSLIIDGWIGQVHCEKGVRKTIILHVNFIN